MTSIIKFQAISGAQGESPPCYILQIDEFRMLLDCGWSEDFDQDFMRELKKHIHQIDAVLLSHPDPSHLGALPYLVGRCGLTCPIYATIPIYKMGQMFMYDLYQSHHNMEDFQLFTLDDVDAAFDKVIQLKFNQSVAMKGKGYGITITPLPAGHMIGGTIWRIFKVGEEDIVYAVDYNHKKERHLNGCELEKIQRPSLLITDAFNATYVQARRRVRDEKLMTNILQTLRNNGNVLVAVDTAGRMLELAHMLEQLWRNRDSGLLAYSLALLNNVSYNTIEFAKSQIEWMSEKLMRSFEGARNNPFQFKYLQLCHSFAELSRVPSPKVVLASTADMESGFSRELFLQWSSNPLNSIILTNRTSPGTLARDLIDNGGDRELLLEVKKRVKLEGVELEEYLKKEEEKKDEKENVEVSSDSEDEVEMIKVTKGKHDFLVKDVKPQTGFFKTSKKQNPMFPYFEKKIKYDAYGEVIDPDLYKLEGDKVDDTKDSGLDECQKLDDKEYPTKCVVYNKRIEVKAQIQYIDFEGRSDGESIQKIITQIRPRRLILVRGSEENMQSLSSNTSKTTDAIVYTPEKMEVVDATTETHIYQIRLTDSLISSLMFQKGKDSELSWVDGQVVVKKPTLDTETTPDQMQVDDPDDEIYTLGIVPMEQVPSHETVFMNEIKLSDLKQVLGKNSVSCEFSGGVLWCCNGTIAIRRLESGRILIEGVLSEDYFRVRELLYQQYAIV